MIVFWDLGPCIEELTASITRVTTDALWPELTASLNKQTVIIYLNSTCPSTFAVNKRSVFFEAESDY
jgi:hypothetical protein